LALDYEIVDQKLGARVRIFGRLSVDTYMLLLVATVALAVVLPASGAFAAIVSHVSYGAVALLFFLYGAKLRTSVVIAGMTNWRLQLAVFATTYVAFPLVGFLLATFARTLISPELLTGLVYLTILPSTVQSSIAFTALAEGNVPAAICAASLSNLLGVLLTPLYAMLLLSATGVAVDGNAALLIVIQILVPFFVGQALHRLIGGWIDNHKIVTTVVDRGSILLIVYSAFSAGMAAGIWGRLEPLQLALIVVFDAALLAAAIFGLRLLGRLTGMPRADRVTLLFCGMQKSLASGVPIANVLFAGHAVSLIILPLMLYHQGQLFVSAALAPIFTRAARREGDEAAFAALAADPSAPRQA
jgi:sodium/bile acid cotransporter 7